MFVELVFFKAVPGIPDAEVLEKAGIIQKLARQQGTEFQLEIFKSADGEWVEIARWNSEADAHQVEQKVLAMPEAQVAMSVMQPDTIRMVALHPA